jgi:uncharacterized protein (TIGR03437 family)
MPLYLLSNEDGPLPRRTGGPFPGEKTCTDVDCHVGTVNTGPGQVSITINGMPADQFVYTPGETVPVIVRVEEPGKVRWGFELTARTPDGCGQAGDFETSPSETPGAVQIFTTNSMDNIPECPPDPLEFPIHMMPKGGPDGASYEFNWTAPQTNVGAITFAAAGNAANGDRDPMGDNIYTTSAVVQPAAGEQAPKPSIAAGGVVLATLTPLVTDASPLAILSIFGQEFAPAGTDVRNPEVDSQGKVSTRLANTCVEINGERAPIFALFPGQINLQSTRTLGTSPASVVVIRACDTAEENSSDPEMVNVAAVAPGFFNSLANQNGVNLIAALHGGGPDPVTAQNPAQPGEFISLFATGLGPTVTAFEPGQLPTAADQITGSFSITIGGVLRVWPDPDIFYVGVAPGNAGLYQIVVKVPVNAANGDIPVTMTVDGVSSPEGPFITVAQP